MSISFLAELGHFLMNFDTFLARGVAQPYVRRCSRNFTHDGGCLMKPAHAIVSLGIGFVLGGCATLLGGTTQTLSVNSNVNGARVFFNDSLLGVTPWTASVPRGRKGVMKVTADGYQPYQVAMNNKVTSLFWVNIFSGTAGSTTDAATGAMYEYEPSTFMVTLQRSNPTPEELAEWRRKEGLRGFVLQNNQAVASDLAAGFGEYIEVLAQLLSVPRQSRAEAIARWRATYLASKTAAEFATLMVAELR